MKKSEDLDKLWEMTEGTPECPKCGSPILVGHIRECSFDLATADWVCELCGHKWSNRICISKIRFRHGIHV